MYQKSAGICLQRIWRHQADRTQDVSAGFVDILGGMHDAEIRIQCNRALDSPRQPFQQLRGNTVTVFALPYLRDTYNQYCEIPRRRSKPEGPDPRVLHALSAGLAWQIETRRTDSDVALRRFKVSKGEKVPKRFKVRSGVGGLIKSQLSDAEAARHSGFKEVSPSAVITQLRVV